ncbi:MAG: hypothetical protein QOE51_3258 [Actinoplanes sp.]|jgi:hypothetical protein|nr:hypothetical protein [Actinoplanes sp.]
MLPSTVRWACLLVAVQAVGLTALTAYLIVATLTAQDVHLALAIVLIVMTALGAAAVAVVARALGRAARGARGPTIVVQLFVIAAGGFLLQTGTAWRGLLLMALGVAVGVLVVLPPSTRAFGLD